MLNDTEERHKENTADVYKDRHNNNKRQQKEVLEYDRALCLEC